MRGCGHVIMGEETAGSGMREWGPRWGPPSLWPGLTQPHRSAPPTPASPRDWGPPWRTPVPLAALSPWRGARGPAQRTRTSVLAVSGTQGSLGQSRLPPLTLTEPAGDSATAAACFEAPGDQQGSDPQHPSPPAPQQPAGARSSRGTARRHQGPVPPLPTSCRGYTVSALTPSGRRRAPCRRSRRSRSRLRLGGIH